jgi:iron complex outermembrane receptor protein
MKGRFFDRRLTINAAGFYMDYSHIQFRSGLVTAGVMKVAVNNAASAKIAGGELSADYNFGNGFSLNSNFTYLHSDVSNYFSASTGTVINGRSLPLAPTWSGSVGADYTRSLGKIGSVDAHVEYTYRSRIIFPFTYDATQNTDGPLGLVNATIRWTHPNGRFYVEGIGRNLTDKLYRVNREDFLPSEELEAFAPAHRGTAHRLQDLIRKTCTKPAPSSPLAEAGAAVFSARSGFPSCTRPSVPFATMPSTYASPMPRPTISPGR